MLQVHPHHATRYALGIRFSSRCSPSLDSKFHSGLLMHVLLLLIINSRILDPIAEPLAPCKMMHDRRAKKLDRMCQRWSVTSFNDSCVVWDPKERTSGNYEILIFEPRYAR